MDQENLAADLKQLILGFESHIREAGSLEQVEDALHHLEENEQHFHKYEFVKQLKRIIEENLGMFVDEEIEKCNMGGHGGVSPGHGVTGGQGGVTQEPLVNHITERVIQSSPMNELMLKLKRLVTAASDNLLKNFDREFGAIVQRQSPTNGKQLHENHFPEDDDTSYVSSLNQPGSLMFMNTDRFVRLTEDLAKTRSFETRQQALHQLNLLPGVEIVCSEQWTNVRKGILDTLADPDHTLSIAALKFIMQAFSTTAPRTVDIYSLLVEHLVLQFTSRKSVIPSLKMGLDVRKPELSRIVKAFRLMNEFQKEAPFYWVRYPEKYMREVLESSLDLLCLSQSTSVCPMHIVAILDPKATWFIRWMHGSYSRAPFLQLLVRYKPLLESAVKHCLQFCQRQKTVSDWSRQKYMHPSKQSVVRLTLSGAELEYAYFVHSVHLLISLVSYTGGRNLFPVKLVQREETVHIPELLFALISLIDDPGVSWDSSNAEDVWSPASVASNAIRFLCSSEEVYAACVCDDRLTNALVQPLRDCLSSVTVPGEATLSRVADILSVIAMSSRGRRQLLYGQNGTLFSKHRSTAASVVAEFTVSALESCLSPGRADSVSKPLAGELLYVCRQLYSTCEGLSVLSPYSLHTCVANALQEACDACDKAATPTPRADQNQDWGSDHIPGCQEEELIWEETLRGNLLSFTTTAKGILLLQQTGALNECVAYLADRFIKKVQVGKCEKFGYGYMVTQVATTAPGMVALSKSGLLESVLTDLWSVLECGSTSIPVVTPRAWPIDPIDPPTLKPLIRLLNMLSSFPAVYEVVADQVVPPQESYSLRQGPQSVASLIDRLVIMNTPAKIHSLFNYEQSHVCGLRLLSVLTSSLDTLLLLQSQYHFQESLLSCQGENTPQNRLYPSESRLSKERTDVIIDMLSVERNYLLVKTYLVGGEGERLLPPRLLLQSSPELYPFPLFSAYPVPREYSTNLSARAAMKQATSKQPKSQDNELSRLLAEGKKKPDRSSEGWVERCRTAMCNVLSTKPEITKGNTIQYLLEQGVIVLATGPDAIFPLTEFSGNEKAVRSYKLSPLQQLGVTLAVRYGSQLKLLSSQSEGTSGLTQLLKLTGSFLQQQQRASGDASPRYMSSPSYPGFDWFVATVYLIFNGSLDRSWKFLQKFSTLTASAYLWPARLHSSVHLSLPLSCGIPPVFYRTGHSVELVLQTEFPLIAAAFKMSGYTPAQICCHWLAQCFWNYLDWLDVCHYVSVVTMLGPDYQVYVCVAILRHLQDHIRSHMHSHDLVIFLKEEPIRGFRLGHHLSFMKTLEEKFRKMILQEMLNFSTS